MSTRIGLLVGVLAIAVVGAAGCDDGSLTGTPFVSTTTTGTGAASLVVTPSTATSAATLPVSVSVLATQNGAPVADNTSVTFSTNLGTFTDSSSGQTTGHTTNGQAGASFTSPIAGTATITVTVGSSTQTTTVTFTSPPGTTP